MKSRSRRFFGAVLFSGLLLVGFAGRSQAYVGASYLWSLSNFTGTVPYHWVNVFTDPSQSEVYVASLNDLAVRVFSPNGMEVYSFGEDSALGAILDGAVHPDGHVFVLSFKNGRSSIIRCNYRGEPESTVNLKNLPPEFEKMSPNRVILHQGRFYIADKQLMRVVVTTEDGVFEKGIDLAALLDLSEKQRADSGLGGFSVDGEGNILFTVPVLFSAYKLAPDGKLASFGEPGQTQGKFGIAAGIVSDGRGNVLVADTLRCVVLIFNEKLRFQGEFGYRGPLPQNLVGPMDLALNEEKLYVTQAGYRGVSVFELRYE